MLTDRSRAWAADVSHADVALETPRFASPHPRTGRYSRRCRCGAFRVVLAFHGPAGATHGRLEEAGPIHARDRGATVRRAVRRGVWLALGSRYAGLSLDRQVSR